MNLKERAKSLKVWIAALFLAMKRKDTPMIAKVFAGMTVGYALSPIDLIPDFVPVLGYLDDLIILPILVVLTLKLIPHHIINACKAEAEGIWKNGKPKKWYYAIPIIVFWMTILYLLVNKMMT